MSNLTFIFRESSEMIPHKNHQVALRNLKPKAAPKLIHMLAQIFCFLCIFWFHRANWHSPATLTEAFPCFFLSCKANARVYFAKPRHGPHSS